MTAAVPFVVGEPPPPDSSRVPGPTGGKPQVAGGGPLLPACWH